jgi:hypothetical protein
MRLLDSMTGRRRSAYLTRGGLIGVRLRLADQRVVLRSLDRLHGKIDIEIWPIQVVRTRKLDVPDFPNGCFAEPRKFVECDEQLPLAYE